MTTLIGTWHCPACPGPNGMSKIHSLVQLWHSVDWMPGTVLWPPAGVQHCTLVDQIIWHFAMAHCSDLAWDDLITLQVQVDENSMEFLLDFLHSTRSVHYLPAVLMWLGHVMSPDCDLWSCDPMTLSHLILSRTPSLCSKSRKEI